MSMIVRWREEDEALVPESLRRDSFFRHCCHRIGGYVKLDMMVIESGKRARSQARA